MSSFFRQNRLRTANYSSELKATIDIHVETYIAENQHDQATIDKINKAREEWIKEVDECEVSNLAELEKREDRDLEGRIIC
jgi:HSP90 family molecular chaperone